MTSALMVGRRRWQASSHALLSAITRTRPQRCGQKLSRSPQALSLLKSPTATETMLQRAATQRPRHRAMATSVL
eukprot:CAMPEP_0181452290 /NCGR_PEP_ID=MMETSP1110-20121109/29131_1 /TAXON_ID=174948 /ORGANISM="Symbiodinium sp., Strain CCMP421" /LENGTH=73 /DNA_ID=CAMNT_0023576569 /DNA_START=333 /DNA_END=554 /DNA_ORIENTATION=+